MTAMFIFVEFGLEEENLSKEEMNDILKALKNSKESVANDEMLRKVTNTGRDGQIA